MTTIRTLTLPHHTITITIRKDRKPHPWNMRHVGEQLKKKREAVRKFLWEQVND